MKETTRILITGANGFIGSNFVNAVSRSTTYNLICPQHNEMSLLVRNQIASVVEQTRPNFVVNLAAYRDANSAEMQRGISDGETWMTNVEGPKNLRSVLEELAIPLIHISTSMVFSGYSAGVHAETDTPESDQNKLSWYGWTKRMGEESVAPYASIVRIGNVTQPTYNPKLDYIGKIQWRSDTGQQFSLFDNQKIRLSRIRELSETLLTIIRQRAHGIFHVASDDSTTPHELAEYLLTKSRPNRTYKIPRMSIEDYLTQHPNRYPINDELGSEFTQKTLGLNYLSWRETVDDFIDNAQ